ncbi:MAG TPA: hypothetical protein VIK97_13160, partial [Casimicrobiaceae bacterium]
MPSLSARNRRVLASYRSIVCRAASLLAAVVIACPTLAADTGALAAQEARHIATTFPGRMAGTPKEDQAAKYIADRLLAMGYRPKLVRFATSYTFRSAKNADRDPDPTLLVSTNVIAEKRGTSGKQIIVGAHFDTRTP